MPKDLQVGQRLSKVGRLSDSKPIKPRKQRGGRTLDMNSESGPDPQVRAWLALEAKLF